MPSESKLSARTMLSRRLFLTALAGAPLAACNTTYANLPADHDLAGWYVGQMDDHPFPIPLVDRSRMKPEFRRQSVSYNGPERPGTIVVDIDQRFLYLDQGNRDILFRIHGTNEPWSIGEQVSSGCIRLLNEDVADLYNRVDVGTTVLVKRNGHYRV